MKLERVKTNDSRLGWKLDVTIAGKRYRKGFKSKKAADDFVAELRVLTQRRRHRLPMTEP